MGHERVLVADGHGHNCPDEAAAMVKPEPEDAILGTILTVALVVCLLFIGFLVCTGRWS